MVDNFNYLEKAEKELKRKISGLKKKEKQLALKFKISAEKYEQVQLMRGE